MRTRDEELIGAAGERQNVTDLRGLAEEVGAGTNCYESGEELAVRLGTDFACQWCGYNLRSLRTTGRCPECGKAVAESIGPGVRLRRLLLVAWWQLGAGLLEWSFGFLLPPREPLFTWEGADGVPAKTIFGVMVGGLALLAVMLGVALLPHPRLGRSARLLLGYGLGQLVLSAIYAWVGAILQRPPWVMPDLGTGLLLGAACLHVLVLAAHAIGLIFTRRAARELRMPAIGWCLKAGFCVLIADLLFELLKYLRTTQVLGAWVYATGRPRLLELQGVLESNRGALSQMRSFTWIQQWIWIVFWMTVIAVVWRALRQKEEAI